MKTCFENIKVGDVICIGMRDGYFTLNNNYYEYVNYYPVVVVTDGTVVVVSHGSGQSMYLTSKDLPSIIRIKKCRPCVNENLSTKL